MIYKLNSEYFVRALLDDDLLGSYPLWFQDQEITQFNSHGKFFKNNSYFAEYIRQSNREDRVVWAICHINDGHIGNISLQNISFINRTAEFAIILGDKKHWGKGVAKLAGNKILEHGFKKLDLERIYCGTALVNEGMKKLARSLNMVHEGTRRNHLYLNGERVDVVEYGILKDEFKALL